MRPRHVPIAPCSYCGSPRHSTAYCPRTFAGQGARASLRCAYCGARDHNRDACAGAWPGPSPVRIADAGRQV